MDKRGAGLRVWMISLAVVILFTFYMLGFVTTFLQEKNPSSQVLNPQYGLNNSYNSFSTSLGSFNRLADNVRTQLSGAKPSAVDYLFLIFQGAFYIPLAFIETVFNGIVLLSGFLFSGISSNSGRSISITTGITLLTASLVITIVLLILKIIRTGESER